MDLNRFFVSLILLHKCLDDQIYVVHFRGFFSLFLFVFGKIGEKRIGGGMEKDPLFPSIGCMELEGRRPSLVSFPFCIPWVLPNEASAPGELGSDVEFV